MKKEKHKKKKKIKNFYSKLKRVFFFKKNSKLKRVFIFYFFYSKLKRVNTKEKRVNTKEVGEYCLVRTEIITPNKTYHITLEKETSIIRKFASGKEFI